MKRIYSIILLFAFTVGAMQPILPMIEYHIFKESIIELFCINKDEVEMECDGMCFLTAQLAAADTEEGEHSAISSSFYPVAVNVYSVFTLQIYPDKADLFIGYDDIMSNLYFGPSPPPPKVS